MASLDHDLVHPTEDGYWLVKQIMKHNCWPAYRISVHSANPVGAANMTHFVLRYGPYDR